MNQISSLAISLPVLLFSVIVHECAHGWTADKFGDSTARMMGRLALNPIPHIDPFGTVLLPIVLMITNAPILIGWAKPVPVNFANLRDPKKNILWVGLSGPISNIIMAAICATFLKMPFIASIAPLSLMFFYGVQINLILAVFNLTPIPPLDGSRFVYSLLPDNLAHQYARLEPYGFLIIVGLMFTGLLDKIIWPMYQFLLYLFHFLGIF